MTNLKVCPICGQTIPNEVANCPHCGNPDPYPDTDQRGRRGRWVQDSRHCFCGERYREEDDVYCRFCGKKRGDAPGRYFKVSPDDMECVYGPMPGILNYNCANCGNSWTSSNWDWQYYCPKCGNRVSATDPDGPEEASSEIDELLKFFIDS